MLCRSSRDERGLVTTEIAIAIPALLLVVGLVIGAIRWSMDAISATSVAAETARAIVRGEPEELSLAASENSVPSADWSARRESLEVCVHARFPPPLPLMEHVTVTQCAPR
ncbi:MAG: hypothetical protein JHC62_02305 [Microbacteriaceae bacterium]|nr:hypothetical protein [Microbacteriaceae bacterium]